MRLFIAIELSDEMRLVLKNIQRQMRRQGISGNFTPEENLHLTLAFIGDYPDPEPVLEVLDEVRMSPVELALNGYGNFGDLWWVGLQSSEALDSYVRQLRHNLAEAGIPFDRKRFTPHMTLVRRARYILLPELQIPKIRMVADHSSLFRSDRGKHGMIYTEIHR